MMENRKVFLSYCHEDMNDKLQIMKYLKGTLNNYGYDLWHDGEILTGSNFIDDVSSALEECSIFICLLSQDYLSSNVCMNTELKTAIERNEIDKTAIFPIILSSCTWNQYVFKDIICQPKDAKPLDKFEDRNECLVNINDELVRVLDELKKKN